MEKDSTIIIGAGQAAARCAVELRRLGYSGKIVLYGEETAPPYQRPELSKSYLARPASATELNVLTLEQAASLDIEIVTGAKVSAVDADTREVRVNDQSVAFDKLVFACGGSARKIDNALSLRTLDDAERLYSMLKSGIKLSVIGGGWLGLEVAATARLHNVDVTVYEQQERLCARVLPESISSLLLEHHQRIGVQVVLNNKQLEPKADTDDNVLCACIGIKPNDNLAREAGIDTDSGIIVNSRQMTSVPNIFAIGDCAREAGRPAMENWAYANVSAERAAHAICDIAPPVAPDLWLWSKQGDLLVQLRGDFKDAQTCVVRKKGDSAAYLYLKENRLQGCITINDPALFGQSRPLFRARRELNMDELADPRVPLNKVKAA